MPGESKDDWLHPYCAQPSRDRFLRIYQTRGFSVIDSEHSIIYQLRREQPYGPVMKEGFVSRYREDWDAYGDGREFIKNHGHPKVIGVPKGGKGSVRLCHGISSSKSVFCGSDMGRHKLPRKKMGMIPTRRRSAASLGALLALVTSMSAPAVQSNGQSPDPAPQTSRSLSDPIQLNSKIVSGFIAQHCVKCHGPEMQKGETRLDTLTLQVANGDTALHWQEVLDVLNLGEMPPEDEPTPPADDLKKVLAHLTEALAESKKRLAESGGDVALRRINRREYRNTIDHLFGLRVPDELLPPDDIAEGYDTVGQDQQFSSYHFEDYYAAAKTIAKVALEWADKPRAEPRLLTMETETRNRNLRNYIDEYDKNMARIKAGETYDQLGFDDEKQFQMYIKRYPLRAGARREYLTEPFADRGGFLLEAGYYRSAGSQNVHADPRATYKFRVVAGLNGKRPPLRHFLQARVGERAIGYLRVEGAPAKPSTPEIEYRPFLTDRIVRLNVAENKGAIGIKDYLKKLDEPKDQSSIWVDRVEAEGPFYSAPSRFETSFQKAFGIANMGEADAERTKNDDTAKRFLHDFMRVAFRHRDPSSAFQKRVFKIYEFHRQRNRSIKESLETPLAMILSSPSFLYLMEDTPANGERTVSDMEFGNRISHFLWSRPADGDLRRAVAEGKLSDPETLKAWVVRMLKHRNSWALSEGFFSRWADLERFDDIAIDESEHLGFNDGIRYSARLEAQHFFDAMIKGNMSVTQLIDSDFVMVNSLLAFHYGLDVPNNGNEFRKTSLQASSPRGGLLGTTAFLTMGSNGERSSPIIRGALVMEKFLHKKPPPPPPNVPELALASDQPLAVKETIQLHREKTQCASCHSRFDPLGFGLENFDLLGQWRDHETVGNIGKKAIKTKGKRGRKDAGGNQIPIRAEGVFPNQKPFSNLQEFRTGLMEEKRLLTRSIAEGLLSYGLGRHIEFADQQALDEICEAAGRNNDRVGDLIFAIVNHPLFRRADQSP